MSKPLNLLAMVLPVLGSALVACVDGLPDDSPGASPSESSEVNPAPAAAAPSPSSSSSAAPSSPSPSPSPSPNADAGTADAAQPSADASTNPSADAGADASADAAPPPPKYSCTPVDLATNAPSPTCATPKANAWAGGTIGTGGYYLTEWSDGTCSDTTTPRQGTMYIEQNGGDLYMRWNRSTPTSTATGTALLEVTSASSLVRTELCSKKAIVLGPAELGYTATSLTITIANGKGYEKWTRIPKTLPTGPIVTDPVIVVGP